MSAPAQVAPLQASSQAPRWNLASRIAFRFCFVYFTLFCVTNQVLSSLLPNPLFDIPDPSGFGPVRVTVFWAAAHLFHAKLPLVYSGSGSGDKTFDWVLVFCLLVTAAAAAGVWSALDRRRETYATMYKWFRLFMRFALASQLLVYGMDKAIPLQMPFPYLTRLLEPYGNFSPMGVLWSSIGASPGYEIFTGCAEMLGGILLFFPRTTMLGALIGLADMTEVFMLNMTYDVPVKLFSFHLVLMSLFLLAPELRRLANFVFGTGAVGPSTQPPLFQSRRANRIALAAQIVFGAWLVGMGAYGGWTAWHTFGGGRTKSLLYGIWNVDELSIDGQVHSPLLTDSDRWRRVVFDFPQSVAFQRMDDSLASFGASIDAHNKTIALTKAKDKNWKAKLTFERQANDRATIDGEMDSHQVHMQLQLVNRSKFLLVSRGFHWIQEYPFNR